MGIALGYAFLVAIAGGLGAICFAYFLELMEDGDQLPHREGEPPHDQLLRGAPSIVPDESNIRRFPASARARPAPQLSLTSK